MIKKTMIFMHVKMPFIVLGLNRLSLTMLQIARSTQRIILLGLNILTNVADFPVSTEYFDMRFCV